MDIEANPVVWRGKLFDSQLEADWYATLLFWKVDARHHPGRIELEKGWWEPDFILYNAGAWGVDIVLEAKGPHNDRLEKAVEVQEANPGLVVLIGRGPFLEGWDRNQHPGAVWERPDGTEYLWDLNGKGTRYVTAQNASEEVPGLTFVKAIGSRSIR